VFGACLGIELLKIERVTCSPLVVGSGTIRCAHGTFPAPAPATVEILRQRGVPYSQIAVEHELLTPTGAALLAVLADSFGPCPAMRASAIGYGAGGKDLPGIPNVLRAVLGEPVLEAPVSGDSVVEFRAVIDDMTAEAIADLLERCLEAGAVEAYALPATMKKSRPGAEVTVLAPPERAAAVQDCLFANSSTFGLRRQTIPRVVLERETIGTEVLGQRVRVKIGRYRGAIIRVQPEYEDCRSVSRILGQPLAEVFRLAENSARQSLSSLRSPPPG
jgi:uncharacterized protein (TIGR00299 family) protein